jgi:hypothetical protein
MRAAVRSFVSPDVDLGAFSPEDPDDFTVLIQAIVGPEGAEGEESLEFIVTTPGALARKIEAEGPVFGRGFVVVRSTDMSSILNTIEKAIARVEGSDWSAVANRLIRLGFYEFEDFV